MPVVAAFEDDDAVTAGRAAATRTADMQASVPLLTSRTVSQPSTRPLSSSARTTSRRVGAPKVVPSPAAARMASTILGWAWPWMDAP